MPEKINIMVMAGTKDAARIIKKLKSSGTFKILATTTTEYGAKIANKSGADEVLSGMLDENDLTSLIKKSEIEILIDATHPFAAAATKNAIKSSENAKIKYIRFERPEEHIIKSNLIHKVFSFEDAALKVLEITEKNDKILHLAGVSTINHVIEKIDSNRIYARVLPSIDSVQKCLDLGLKQENIIAMQGTFSKSFNKSLMEEYDISAIITKESGATGGTASKIDAALELGIHTVLVIRPNISELSDKDVFTSFDEILSFILN
ncbi:MAG TPA: precorrin-6A reductase [Methanobacterium sp.]|nr:precorrin-6A reductase [Methanobacterium sp.]